MIRRVAHNKFMPDSLTKVIRVLWARDVERGLAEIALRLTVGHPVLECRELSIDKIPVLDSVGRVAKWRFLEDRLAWLWARGYALIRNLTYLFNDLNKRSTETRRIASRKKIYLRTLVISCGGSCGERVSYASSIVDSPW
jgi:hypothetical protein